MLSAPESLMAGNVGVSGLSVAVAYFADIEKKEEEERRRRRRGGGREGSKTAVGFFVCSYKGGG